MSPGEPIKADLKLTNFTAFFFREQMTFSPKSPRQLPVWMWQILQREQAGLKFPCVDFAYTKYVSV